jgi:UDP-2,3-diacylglucosamine pyrophosphatase LpxH
MLKSNHYRTIVISDVHLGTKNSKAKEVVRFLKTNTCEKLILNGDIIDGWQLRKGSEWKKKHTRFFRVILKMMDKHKTDIIYLRGNHDDFLDNLIPLQLNRLTLVKDYYLTSGGKKFYVLHGDIFDTITTNMRWLAKLGDVGYTLLLWLNKIYNRRRQKKGLPYYSFSQYVKQKVKSAVSYISDFEKELVNLAHSRNCQGVICGHIHHPAITQYGDLIYMNSGDWVESLSALVEDFDNNWSIVLYSDLLIEENEND